MKRFLRKAFAICIVGAVAVTVFAQKNRSTRQASMNPPEEALKKIDAGDLLSITRRLSSDEFEGRSPGSRGEDLSINYIADQFKAIGLEPGNTDGTYFQRVPLIGTTVSKDQPLEVKAGGRDLKLKYGDDYMAWTKQTNPTVSFDSDMVFVGYGAVAPEYSWDDFKNVDVRGKVLVMLVGDPPVPDPKDPSKLDPNTFKGRAMTYYGRWTYKFEIAAQKGAAGALIVHETGPAGYPWDVVKNSNSLEQFEMENATHIPIEGWITSDRAKEIFSAAGKDFAALKQAAVRRDFKPVDLGARASLTMKNTVRHIESHNVIGKLEGSDPKLKNEYVLYMAHWDHLGIGDPDSRGDRIYNGALDNATGVAGVIDLAKAFKALPTPPRRSILFLSVTAEEKGLLGSAYYATHPIYPIEKTVAVINMDGLDINGPTRDITVIGLGNSTLDDVLKKAAAEKGRTLRPDAEPEKGFYYRSDHFSFAKEGVPALDPEPGINFIGKPEGWGLKKRDEYTRLHYHQPSDEVTSDWNLSGAVEDLQLFMTVGYRVANTDAIPEWKPGTEFKAKREQMLRQTAGTR